MGESIAGTSLFGHRPIFGARKNLANKPKLVGPITKFTNRGKPLIHIIKAQAAELTKEAFSFHEKELRKQSKTETGLWPPTNRADNPALNNPLLRQERMGSGWLGVIFEWEGVLVEDNLDLENQAWLVLSKEEGKSPPPAFLLRRIEGMKNEQAIGEVLCWSRNPNELRRMGSRKEEIYQSLHGGVYRFRLKRSRIVDFVW